MALRIMIALGLGAIALAVALVAHRQDSDHRAKAPQRSGSPIATGHSVPAQIYRSDFVRPETTWLVVLFSSAACGGCADMAKKVAVLDSEAVATTEIEYSVQPALHTRYNVDAVPLIVIADCDGVVRRSFFGSTSATDLWAALAELRV